MGKWIEALLGYIGGIAIALISTLGYGGILVGMALESACIPLPSEIIMPFAGFLVSKGEMSLVPVVLAGTFGNLIGSCIAYGVGYWGGRPLLLRYGQYVLISAHELDRADRWFARWGEATAFFSRLLPVVRTFISLPAGISRMHFGKFCVYTFLGALPFVSGLTYLGYTLGAHWNRLRASFHWMDTVIGVLLALGLLYFIYRHFVSVRAKSPLHASDYEHPHR